MNTLDARDVMSVESNTRVLVVNDKVQIPFSEISFSFVRSSGPGGQNVNKVASKAVLRWKVLHSTAITEEMRSRMLKRFRRRVSQDGDLLITSQRYRTQHRNQTDCLEKLRGLVLSVAEPPQIRRGTRPTAASKRRRRHDKQIQSQKKQQRSFRHHDD